MMLPCRKIEGKNKLRLCSKLRSGSIFVSLCNNIPAGKAKRKPILAVAVRTAKIGPDLRLFV